MFSKACELAIKAMIYLETYGNETKLNLNEISEAIGSPVAFTSKILQELRKNGLLTSTKGINGGFQIPNNRQIDLKEIVTIMDGDAIFNNCALGLETCSSLNPCPIHDKYIAVKRELLKIMLDSHLKEFSQPLKDKLIQLK